MAFLELRNIAKEYKGIEVLHEIDLSIQSGSLHTLFGPSGCGKSTILRILSGLETPDKGSILLDGVDITSHPPEKRGITMVFQQFSLFPSMNVMDNITYGLKIRGKSKGERRRRGEELLSLIRLEGFGDRSITDLSGGEKQRVAIARALAPDPRVLLMDEPLSSLDVRLKESLRGEIARIHRETGTTIVFVTHDMEEAMELSDSISVMNSGKIIRTGTPSEIYDGMGDHFTERFVGRNNSLTLEGINYLIRPERITIETGNLNDPNGSLKDPEDEILKYHGSLISSTLLGDRIRLRIQSQVGMIEAIVLNDGRRLHEPGDSLTFSIRRQDMVRSHEE